jgi:transcription elongation factor GreA
MYFKVIGGVEENCLLGTLPTQAVFNFLANFKKLIEGEKKMSTEKEVILTPEGLDKLEKELEVLKTVKRREVAERIKEAIEFGDITENSEYEAAKNDQAFIEGRIITLEKMLRNARVIEHQKNSTGIVHIGTKVKLQDLASNEELVYTLVGSAEADPMNNKISNESPVGKAIMGKKTGDIVEVDVPIGKIKYKIMQVF